MHASEKYSMRVFMLSHASSTSLRFLLKASRGFFFLLCSKVFPYLPASQKLLCESLSVFSSTKGQLVWMGRCKRASKFLVLPLLWSSLGM